jgi:hypothetical protein
MSTSLRKWYIVFPLYALFNYAVTIRNSKELNDKVTSEWQVIKDLEAVMAYHSTNHLSHGTQQTKKNTSHNSQYLGTS